MRTPFLLAALVIVGALATMTASAAGMGVDATDAATGTAVIEPCQEAAFVATPQSGGGNLTGVTITGIQPGCTGGSMQVVITDTAGTKLTGGTAGPITSTHVSGGLGIPMPATPATSVARIHIVVVGP